MDFCSVELANLSIGLRDAVYLQHAWLSLLPFILTTQWVHGLPDTPKAGHTPDDDEVLILCKNVEDQRTISASFLAI